MNSERVDVSRPASHDAERSVLSSLLSVPGLFDGLPDLTDAIYEPPHKIVYNAIRDHHDQGLPIELVSISETLRVRKQLETIGGPLGLADIASFNPAPAVVKYHAQVVCNHALRRQVIEVANRAVTAAYGNGSVDELLEQLQSESMALHATGSTNVGKDLADCVLEAIDRAEELSRTEGLLGIPTGIPLLDQFTSGYRPGLNVICARPSMGKSAFALQGALAAVAAGHKVGFFSFEMEGAEVGERTVQHLEGISLTQLATRIKANEVTKDEWSRSGKAAAKVPKGSFFVDDKTNRSLADIRSIARSWVVDRGVGAIYVDQLSFVEIGSRSLDNLAAELGRITRGLHQLGHALGVPVILLAQLNRQAEGQIPTMSMLKGSGSIEEDARLILSPFRDDLRNADNVAARIIPLKTRGVAMFEPVYCTWDGSRQQFTQTVEQVPMIDQGDW